MTRSSDSIVSHNSNRSKFWDGNKNYLIRLYFYSQRGLVLFNEFRYLFVLIFGIYILLKLSNIAWLVIMFGISIPILICIGWYQVHHMAKVTNWLDIEFGSYWSRYSFELMEKQARHLENIDNRMQGQ